MAKMGNKIVNKAPAERKIVEQKQRVVVASRGREGRNPILSVVDISNTGNEYEELTQKYDIVVPMFNPTMFNEINTPELVSLLTSLATGIDTGSLPPLREVEDWLAEFPQQFVSEITLGDEVDFDEDPEEEYEPESMGEGVSGDPYYEGFMEGLNYGVTLTRENMMFVLDMVEKIRGKKGEEEKPKTQKNTAVIAEMLRKIKR